MENIMILTAAVVNRLSCVTDINRLVPIFIVRTDQKHLFNFIYAIGVPFPPQGLMSRVLEYGSEYFTIEMTWEHAYQDIDSRVDFYHYQVVDGLSEENASVVLDLNTTNTTKTLIR